MYWNQETADWMWIGYRDKYNQQVMRNPNLMAKETRQYTSLPAGHPEGWNDAERNNIYSFYKYILDGKKLGKDLSDFATFDEAHYIIKLTEAILESSKTKRWIKV
jgi:predicted dehydrogenase